MAEVELTKARIAVAFRLPRDPAFELERTGCGGGRFVDAGESARAGASDDRREEKKEREREEYLLHEREAELRTRSVRAFDRFDTFAFEHVRNRSVRFRCFAAEDACAVIRADHE